MDERIASLLREANDPVSLAEVCGLMLRYPADHSQIRSLLHPHVRQCEEAREVFLRVLPPGVNAFCVRCREPFELNDEGYPKGKRESVPRKKRRLCDRCEADRAQRMAGVRGRGLLATESRDAVASSFNRMLYCGRCGSVARSGHNCGLDLPAWISGGQPGQSPAKPVAGHWSLWRDA